MIIVYFFDYLEFYITPLLIVLYKPYIPKFMYFILIIDVLIILFIILDFRKMTRLGRPPSNYFLRIIYLIYLCNYYF